MPLQTQNPRSASHCGIAFSTDCKTELAETSLLRELCSDLEGTFDAGIRCIPVKKEPPEHPLVVPAPQRKEPGVRIQFLNLKQVGCDQRPRKSATISACHGWIGISVGEEGGEERGGGGGKGEGGGREREGLEGEGEGGRRCAWHKWTRFDAGKLSTNKNRKTKQNHDGRS